MSRYIEGQDRQQVTLLPECQDDFIAEDNPIRVVDVFVGELNLAALGFEGSTPAFTGRPSYHPAVLLKIYIYGYLNRVQSSRRLERECQRNVELMWLTGHPEPGRSAAPVRRQAAGRAQGAGAHGQGSLRRCAGQRHRHAARDQRSMEGHGRGSDCRERWHRGCAAQRLRQRKRVDRGVQPAPDGPGGVVPGAGRWLAGRDHAVSV